MLFFSENLAMLSAMSFLSENLAIPSVSQISQPWLAPLRQSVADWSFLAKSAGLSFDERKCILRSNMHKPTFNRRVANGIGYGLSMAERGLGAYNTIRAGYAAGSALVSAATPYLVGAAAVL